MSASAPRLVVPARAVLGEGPVWDARAQALYWLDIKGLRIHRYDPADGATAIWPTPYRIGSLAPRARGGFIGGSERGVVAIDAAFTTYHPLFDPEPQLPGNRANDGQIDRDGRFWLGTMDDAEVQATGSLYRVDADGAWAHVDGGYQVTNGPAFSPDGRVLYHTDSARQMIYRFDLAADGTISGKRVFAQFDADDGYPDGMTVDAEGCLWIAFWDGWCLRRLSPGGAVIATVPVPVQRPTSCTFGGTNLDRLYVTSATIGLDDEALATQPGAGGLFVLDPGVTGIAAVPFAG